MRTHRDSSLVIGDLLQLARFWLCNLDVYKRMFYFPDDLYQLIVDDVKNSDIGTYVCRVTNDVGKSSCSANLYVDRAVTVPHFVGKDEPVHALFEGDELRFALFCYFLVHRVRFFVIYT